MENSFIFGISFDSTDILLIEYSTSLEKNQNIFEHSDVSMDNTIWKDFRIFINF